MSAGARERSIAVADLTDADEAAWLELARSVKAPNPFFEPMFVVPADAHLRKGEVTLVVLEDSAGWLACLPVTSGRWRGPVSAVRALSTPYSFAATPLLRDGFETEDVYRLIESARSFAGRRLLVIERFRDGTSFAAALRELEASGMLLEAFASPIERALLRRRADGDYLSNLKAKRRKELRRLRRRIEEEIGTDIEVADLSSEPSSAEAFLTLEASGWKGREGTAMASKPDHASFFRALCGRATAEGKLEMLALRTGDQVLAMLCNLRAREGAYSFKIAFDEDYSRFSPGLLLEVANFDFFHASGSEWIDSCADPDNEMINRLWPDRRRLLTVALVKPGIRGRIEAGAIGAAGAARERVRARRG